MTRSDFGEDPYAVLNAAMGEEFGADDEEFGEEFGGDEFGGRAARKRRRKKRRAKIRGALKKVAKNKFVQAVGKIGLSMVPGGSAVTGVASAVKAGVTMAKAAKKNPVARAGLELATAAKEGDKNALATLRSAATGTKSTLPRPPTKVRAAVAKRRAQRKKQTGRADPSPGSSAAKKGRPRPPRAAKKGPSPRKVPPKGKVAVVLSSGKQFTFSRSQL